MRKFTLFELGLYMKGLADSGVRTLPPEKWAEVQAMVWNTEMEPPGSAAYIDHARIDLPCAGCK